ncbi:heterokaryon incompatibility protein-domain-containing protein, partial [Truncatella angustata]
MRLLKAEADGRVVLTECFPPNIPKYAILSHTWGPPDQEVTFQDISDGTAASKRQTAADGLQYFWIDTCCIDKTSSAELTEAINSMFEWYREAQHCYVYLSDVSTATDDGRQADSVLRLWDAQFRKSNWFKRGWTLQELLAPGSVKFFSVQGDILGNRMSLKNAIHTVTNIEVSALDGRPLYDFPVHKRLQWSSSRTTTKEEDAAYCLLGIFGVYLPLIYGEGKTSAMNRM